MRISKVGKVAGMLFLFAGSQGHAGSIQMTGPNGNYEGVAMGIGQNTAQLFDSRGNYAGTLFASPSQGHVGSQGHPDLSAVGKDTGAINSLESLTGISE